MDTIGSHIFPSRSPWRSPAAAHGSACSCYESGAAGAHTANLRIVPSAPAFGPVASRSASIHSPCGPGSSQKVLISWTSLDRTSSTPARRDDPRHTPVDPLRPFIRPIRGVHANYSNIRIVLGARDSRSAAGRSTSEFGSLSCENPTTQYLILKPPSLGFRRGTGGAAEHDRGNR